jgi:50S ribosomal protein L16 3-hydroxylase
MADLLDPTAPAWRDFISRSWERNAAALPGVWPSAPASPELLFGTSVEAADRLRAGDATVQFSLFVAGDEVEAEQVVSHLPRARDGSLRGWAARLDDQLSGAEFTLLLAEPHLYARELWTTARGILRGLFSRTGIPCGGVDTAMFVGRYRKTPFGVHRGQMSVLTFPTEGTKHFRLWPRGYGEAHPNIRDSLDYGEHLEPSFLLEGKAGDALYWPADLWHIAEGTGEFTAAWNVGFWWDGPPVARVLGALAMELEARVGERDPRGVSYEVPGGRGDGAAGAPAAAAAVGALPLERLLPERMQRVTAATAQMSGTVTLETLVSAQWLRLLSADGFRLVPPRSPLAIDLGDVLLLDPDAGLWWAADSAGRLHVAAQGHTVLVPDSEAARVLLGRLRAGAAVPVRELPPGATVDHELQPMLALLLATRAVSRRPAGAP